MGGHHFGHGLAYGHGYGHGYYGHPYAYGHNYGKRSADAEPAADADAYYGYPLVAAVPRVSTVHGGPLHGLTAVSHGLYGHYYGKRSADAEPTAAALLRPMPTTTTATPTTATVSTTLM